MAEKKKLKTALIGLGGEGLALLQAAVDSGFYDIRAVAGNDPEQTVKVASKYDCRGFDDYRQLVVQAEPEVLIAAAGAYICDEHMRLAMKNGVHVIKSLPVGVDYEQTAELVSLAEKNKVRFLAAGAERYCKSFRRLGDFVNNRQEGFYLINGHCFDCEMVDRFKQGWMNDPQVAGGGVLLWNCYSMIYQIVRYFGLPEKVYSLNTNLAPDRQQRLSITEDTAAVTLKFSDTLIGNIIASRTFGPKFYKLSVYCRDGFAEVETDTYSVFDVQGNQKENTREDYDKKACMVEMFSDFARGILHPEQAVSILQNKADLDTMAVIQSAYLSARTAMAEDPSRILNMKSAETANIWSGGGKGIV